MNYKHKTTGRIAEQFDRDDYNIIRPKTENTIETTYRGLPKELIEDSNDWIEIKEEDWIDLVWKDYLTIEEPMCGLIRKSINKHLPRITDDMIEKMRNDYMNSTLSNKYYFIESIKQNLPKDLLANPTE